MTLVVLPGLMCLREAHFDVVEMGCLILSSACSQYRMGVGESNIVLQEAAQGKYYYLPNASDKAIAQAASSAMSEAKAA